MKGIILAGGLGTRLSPLTDGLSKHLLPIYDKPMIYYPLSVLMLGGIKEILIITNSSDLDNYKRFLQDGSQIGISISYAIQDKPKGIPDAFIIGQDFIGSDDVTLILGDNLFWGQGFQEILKETILSNNGSSIFVHKVKDPARFGIAEIDKENNVISIEEKPRTPKSNLAITGLYIYSNDVVKFAKELKPSSRGETEITDINKKYLENNLLRAKVLGRGFFWMDAGTIPSLMQASLFVKTVQEMQGFKISCIEEIALLQDFISFNEFQSIIKNSNDNEYSKYLKTIKPDFSFL